MIHGILLLLGAGLFWCGVGTCYEWIPSRKNALACYMFCSGISVNFLAWTLFIPTKNDASEILEVAWWLIPSGCFRVMFRNLPPKFLMKDLHYETA